MRKRLHVWTVTAVVSLAATGLILPVSANQSAGPTAGPPPASSSELTVNSDTDRFMIQVGDLEHGISANMPSVQSFDSGTAASPGRNTFISWNQAADFGAFQPKADK